MFQKYRISDRNGVFSLHAGNLWLALMRGCPDKRLPVSIFGNTDAGV